MSEPATASQGFIFLDALVFEDIRRLCALTADTGFFSEAEVLIVDELAKASLSQGEASGYHMLLAVADPGHRDRLLGFACFGPVPGTAFSWHLYWVVVDKSMQGQGVGRRLHAEVEARVLGRGGRKLFLETSSRAQYQPTRGFYESCGYLAEARLADYYAPGEDCIHYSKVL